MPDSTFTLFLFLAFFLCKTPNADAQSIQGSWVNELGSTLVIDSLAVDNTIYGKYKSSSGVDGKVFPLQGWVNDKDSSTLAVAFIVKWDGYGSLTSWTGYLGSDEEGRFIKTLWHLVRPTEENGWERIITNSSLFRQED